MYTCKATRQLDKDSRFTDLYHGVRFYTFFVDIQFPHHLSLQSNNSKDDA